MNSETDRPTPPRLFNRRRNETSVTPAIGERTNGGSISMSRIRKGLISATDEHELGFLRLLLLVFVVAPGCDWRRYFQERRDAGLVSLGDFYKRIVSQVL